MGVTFVVFMFVDGLLTEKMVAVGCFGCLLGSFVGSSGRSGCLGGSFAGLFGSSACLQAA